MVGEVTRNQDVILYTSDFHGKCFMDMNSLLKIDNYENNSNYRYHLYW